MAEPHDHAPDEEDLDEDELERRALGRIVFAYRQYRTDAEAEIARWEANYARLTPRHKALLHTQPAKFAAARRAAHQNHLFITALIAAFDEDNAEEGGGAASHLAIATAAGNEAAQRMKLTPLGDVEKVRYALKNLARDWSEECAAERAQSYGRIVAEVQRLFSGWPQDAAPPFVLVPGCGLGRLPLDLAAAGFRAQGNEFSYFMLLGSSFVLNHTVCTRQWTLHPWLLSNCNHLSDADQLRGVAVPDVAPGEAVAPGLLSMCAGDFAEVYARPTFAATFDCVVTCFFLDTAHNFIEYLETIHNTLKPGGYWVHLGPLLWHWADSGLQEQSVEASLAEVLRVAGMLGFRMLRQEVVPSAYIANPRAMYQTVYQAAFWTMVKTGDQLPGDQELVAAAVEQKQAALAAAKQQQAAARGQAAGGAAGAQQQGGGNGAAQQQPAEQRQGAQQQESGS